MERGKVYKSLEEANDAPELVRVLDLSGQDLVEAPQGLSVFENLEVLDLSNNQLNSLSDDFGELKSLKRLVLHHNMFNKFPESLLALKNLSWIDLSYNSVRSFEENVSVLSETLKTLDLSNNLLSKNDEEELVNFLPATYIAFSRQMAYDPNKTGEVFSRREDGVKRNFFWLWLIIAVFFLVTVYGLIRIVMLWLGYMDGGESMQDYL